MRAMRGQHNCNLLLYLTTKHVFENFGMEKLAGCIPPSSEPDLACKVDYIINTCQELTEKIK